MKKENLFIIAYHIKINKKGKVFYPDTILWLKWYQLLIYGFDMLMRWLRLFYMYIYINFTYP